mgnify:FL=1
MKTISELQNTINEVRNEAVNAIISIMSKNNRKEVYTYEFDSTPIIIDSNDCDETYTLDAIRVVEGTTPYIIFSCSSSYDNNEVTSGNTSTDNLLYVLEWITDNEESLFENEDE